MNGNSAETRVLLLTDVVDSTLLSERLGDEAIAGLWAAHDRVARDLLRVWRGREIDKTDGMLLMFDAASDAVGYAQAYHRALAGLSVPLQARAGLHVAPVILRHNAAADVAQGAKPLEVDGLAKPTTARIMALAGGGQTLLTAEARAALADAPLHIHSHGHWVVKGLTDPIALYEVGEADSPFATPHDGDKAYQVVRIGDQWQPVREIPNNLPQQVTSFVGREREVREVKRMVGTMRLVTLLGMGGLGKTRLSLRVAAQVLGQFPDGVWFLDLAPIRDPALVLSEAAQVLDVREEPDQPLVKTVCAALKSRRALLIFDNCEHVIKAAAELAAAILRGSQRVHILASSREALRVPGEQSYPVLPLPVPDAHSGLDALSRSTAVRLFVERAQLQKPTFTLNDREAPAVAELVVRLEGIPLALELAAARMRVLSVADINARLKDRYKVLTGGGRVLLERQQTLRALVDWSYELLAHGEQTVLNRLGIFAGGFDLSAAEAICGAEPLLPEDVLDHLSSLVEKSLVMTGDTEDGTRYRLLETIRDYAREKQDADDAAATAARHCQHYFGVAKAVRDGLKGAEQAQWVRRGETELDNMRVAIGGVLFGPDAVLAVKYAVALTSFWTLRGYTSEGRKIVRIARSQPAVRASDVALAHALFVEAALATDENDHAEARKMLETCLALRRRLGSLVEIAATLSTLSLVRLQGGDASGAAESEREALAIFRDLGEQLGEAIGLLHLGQIAV
ncbi:MAG TPA: NB-ARC domain-containing protein, partial [Burkholderiaceae bacterium]|nr:NB-ARC domain-containing protein [Burkholderiaceae bacterium]